MKKGSSWDTYLGGCDDYHDLGGEDGGLDDFPYFSVTGGAAWA